jgi:hypothetical protein
VRGAKAVLRSVLGSAKPDAPLSFLQGALSDGDDPPAFADTAFAARLARVMSDLAKRADLACRFAFAFEARRSTWAGPRRPTRGRTRTTRRSR